MKKLLLLVPFLAFVLFAKAQVYTITDEGGDPIVDGSTINVVLVDANTNDTQHLTLHSTTSDDIVFQVMGTSQVDGTQNFNCVGEHCYAPNDLTSHTESLVAGDIASLSLEYKPNGYSESAKIEFRISEPDNAGNSITFFVEWSLVDAIEDINTKPTFIAYPNPANSKVTITYNASEKSNIVFYNIVGEQVKKISVNPGSSNLEVEVSDLSAGTYFYSMVSNSKVSSTKRLVIKH